MAIRPEKEENPQGDPFVAIRPEKEETPQGDPFVAIRPEREETLQGDTYMAIRPESEEIMEKTMEKIVALAKSRGFVYPGLRFTAAWPTPGITEIWVWS